MKKFLIALAILAAVGLGAFFFVAPSLLEKSMNAIHERSSLPPQVAGRARDLHAKLLIADPHADSLLWDRDLLERATRGHVGVPRLIEGNVALQMFTVVTKTPRNLNIEGNDDRTDNITLLALAERWPIATWISLKERALYQAQKLQRAAARSGGKFVVIKSAADLAEFLARRRGEPTLTAGLLGIEGAHALDGDPAVVDAFFAAGFRMMAPTHFFDNDIAGSAHGLNKGGLTDKGSEVIRRMEAQRMIVDLAHASAQTIEDVLRVATRPVVVSHTGVKGTCPNTRNLSDAQLRAIARGGGVIGIGYWETATCGWDARAIARAVRHTTDLIGVRHVALGSDFDGAVAVPFDTTGLVEITASLLAEGFRESEIEIIMGGNVIRLLLEVLPQ